MKYLFFLSMLFSISVCLSQGISGNGFEVHTHLKYPSAKQAFTVNKVSSVAQVNAIPDTALQTATFVYTGEDAADIAALELTITDSRNQIAYQINTTIGALTTSGQYKVIGQTIYVTAGSFPYLKKFTAQLRTTDQDGVKGGWKTYVKH